MATAEQKAASRRIMDTVTKLNTALLNASSADLFVELKLINGTGHNGQYRVEKIETRETVLP